MIPWECKHSIARAISSAKPTTTCVSKQLGRMFRRYLRNVPPNKSSVTITITGSLHAPINCKHIKIQITIIRCIQRQIIYKKVKNFRPKTTFTKFLCWTLDNMATSLAKRASLFAISSGVSPLWPILIATFWFLYLKVTQFKVNTNISATETKHPIAIQTENQICFPNTEWNWINKA